MFFKAESRHMSRRSFIQSSLLTATLGSGIIDCVKKLQKPNLLFIWTDEQRADTMSVYGNNKIQAPNLNKLSKESIVFKNAYVSQPVCTPSRSTVMTGLWPHTSNCTSNNIALSEEIQCFPELLNDPDYRTGYFGKWHLGDEIFPQHGFEEWESMEDGYWAYYSKNRDKNQKSSYCEYLKELGYQPDTKRNDFSRKFAVRLPLEHCKPKFLEQKVQNFLQRNKNNPFILYINFLEPHMPFYGPLNEKHQPDNIDLPINFNDPLEENEPLRYRLLREKYYQNGFDGHNLRKETGWRRLIANYWGLVTQVDLSVGAILKTLEDLGLVDNTIVVYTSDHGDMMGSHRLLTKTVMYEESVKVPWLMRIPQISRQQKIIEQPVSHIDLVPTLLDLMNVRKDHSLPGQSLVPLMKGGQVEQDNVFIEWNPAKNRGITSQSIPSVTVDEVEKAHRAYTRTIISRDGWKLCLSNGDLNQLFNLYKDPGETTNLYYSGNHENIIKDLSEKIRAWQEKARDTVELNIS